MSCAREPCTVQRDTGHRVRISAAAKPPRDGAFRAPPSLMARAERRAGSRVRCGSAAAYLTHHRHTHTALVADVSHTGMQLRGSDLPELGAWVSLIFVAPPRELGAIAHVAWKDDRRGAIGVALERGTHGHDHQLAAMLLELAFEAEAERPGALVLCDDAGLAAELCEPLRREGLLPHAPLTALDAIVALEHGKISVAVVSGRPFGMTPDDVAGLLADEYPQVSLVPLEHLQAEAGAMEL